MLRADASASRSKVKRSGQRRPASACVAGSATRLLSRVALEAHLSESRATAPTEGVRNRLLAALPPEDRARLLPQLQPQSFRFGEILFRADAPLDSVVFPEAGWVSLIATLQDGSGAEVGIVGREGMVGLPLLFGTDRMPMEALWQADGTALRMEAQAFRVALDESAAFRRMLLRYAMAHNVQVSQTAVCNSRHRILQRLSRWLLMSHDRAMGNAFDMTHELMALMLGVRRAGISAAAAALQRAGLIRYGHGRVTVIDRPGLEAAACECYRVVRREFGRLLDLR